MAYDLEGHFRGTLSVVEKMPTLRRSYEASRLGQLPKRRYAERTRNLHLYLAPRYLDRLYGF